MLEIIEKILAAEKDAEDIVQTAKDKAAVIRADADSKAEKLVKEQREAIREKNQALISEVRNECAEKVLQATQGEANREDEFLKANSKAIDALVEEVVDLISKGQLA